MTDIITLEDQIREVGREIGMRRATYPKWVPNRMSQAEADYRIAVIESVYALLKKLQNANHPPA